VPVAALPVTPVSQMRTVASKLPLKGKPWRPSKPEQRIRPGVPGGGSSKRAWMQGKRGHTTARTVHSSQRAG